MTYANPFIASDTVELLSSNWSNKKEYRNLVVKKRNPNHRNNHTKLSDVFTKFPFGLPHGIVAKEETGMGATTLELRSHRNSIVVEPIKITASSKAYEHGFFYVGSPTKYHPDKVSDEDIIRYLINTEIEFKKILVVADSLGRVMNALSQVPSFETINKMETNPEKRKAYYSKIISNGILKIPKHASVLDNYFLLIDEIDSFQLDSSYRKNMEICLDYYKLFKPENRCMLSATNIMLTDPEMSNEELTRIRYDEPTKRKINIVSCTGKLLHGNVYDKIIDLLNQDTINNILVAYNSVSGCYKIAENLSRKNAFLKGDIKILCSEQSKEDVGEYYQELENDTLPSRINFITSAYFTGFDLNERFHLVSVSGNRNSIHALSERRLKQIAGRCRYGLLSETIIHDIVPMPNFKSHFKDMEENQMKIGISKAIEQWKKEIVKRDPTKSQLIQAAKEEVEALNCMNNHYKKNKILNGILEEVNDRFMRILDEKGMRFIRRDKSYKFKISYLNIDAKLESNRVRKDLYLDYKALSKRLSDEGHKVKSNWVDSASISELENINISSINRDESIRAIIQKLKTIKNRNDIDLYLKNNDFNVLQKKIIKDFQTFYGFLHSISFLDKIQSTLLGKRDTREYNSLLISAKIQTLPKGHLIVDRLQYYFKPKCRFTNLEILKRMNLFLLETGNIKQIKKPISAIRLLKNFRKIYKKKNKKTGLIFYHITNTNPQNIKCLRKKSALEKIDKLI